MTAAGKLLIHTCCAHCTAYTVEHWRSLGYDVTGLWFNPNIHPFTEHNLRLEAMQQFSHVMDFQLVVLEGYEFWEYFRRVAGHETERCGICFDLRLDRVARKAAEMGIGAFTSSLLISPHQQHEVAKTAGERVAAQNGVQFLYADLRKRYSDSRRITKPIELYRQQYCGCVYSEYERYHQHESEAEGKL
ncbi:MAG: epoxyqueuosine reductase QueH [Dehalococcoidia bacterium]|nr:epoxyqueuosine reductase QueH [Dehalococcoidia bacterium]